MPQAPAARRIAHVPSAEIIRAGLGRRLPRGYVRIGPAITIPGVLTAYGIDPLPIYTAAGVAPEVFGHPDNALPMAHLGRLAQLSAESTGREDFGLLVAEGTSASNLGLLGFLVKQAPDVRTALKDITRYLHHTDHAAVPSFAIQGEEALVGYSIIEPKVPAADIICDGAIAIYRNILKGLCGPQWEPMEVRISRRRPAHPARYERYFGVPVLFDTEATTLTFDARWLEMPLPHADAALRQLLQEQIDLLEAEEAGHLSEQVRRLLRTSLLTRGGSIDDIAGLLRLSRRTLSRRLDQEGTTFRQLTDEIRFEVARQFIENTTMSMTQIALAMKYSETSAFSRAFRQWSGLAPRAWRTRHLAGGGRNAGEPA